VKVREPAPLSGPRAAEEDEPPTPDLRDLAHEVRKRLFDEDDKTQPFPPDVR
jgi:hypothetical protein